MNLLLFNAEFGGNKGAEAMLLTVLQWLQEKEFQGTVYLERSKFTSPETIGKGMMALGPLSYSWDWFEFIPAHVIKYVLSGYRDARGNIIPIDMAVDLGGLAFHDATIRGCLRTLFRFLPLRIRSVPYSFFIQDFGPMKKKWTRLMAALTLQGADKIFVRSAFSRRQLLDMKGLEEKILGPYPDMTLRLKGNRVSEKLPLPEHYVVVCPSIIPYLREGDSYLCLLKDLCGKARKHYPLVILVHTFQSGNGNSDSTVARKLLDQLQDNDVVQLLDENLDARILKGVISSAELVISSRFHALVAALSCGVPALGIGWNPKYDELFSLYSIPDASLNTAMSGDELEIKINTFLDHNTRKQLQKVNQSALGSLNVAFDQLEQELRKYSAK